MELIKAYLDTNIFITFLEEEIDKIGEKYRRPVDDEDDLPHINAYFAAGCDYFITVNRRLTQMKIKDKVNFISPKRFLVELGIEPLDRKTNA